VTLVERFIEFNGWSTSRKTALLAGLGLAMHIAVALTARIALATTGIVNLTLNDEVWAAGAISLVACLVASLICLWIGTEGRWTAYLLVILYGGFNIALILSYGIWGTAYIAFYPLAVVLAALWYDERVGWFGFLYGSLVAGVFAALELLGVLPYAPVLVNRTIGRVTGIRLGSRRGLPIPGVQYLLFCAELADCRRAQASG
jgi:hypothetical protein